MVEPISTGISSLRAAFDVTKALLDVHGAVKIDAQVFQLQRHILEAQAAEATLASEKRQLEERVRELEAWDGEKERYQFSEVGFGTFAYSLKPEAQGTEPFHMLCTDCYQRHRKSVLQREQTTDRRMTYRCHGCKLQLVAAPDVLEPLGWRIAGTPA